MVGAFASRDQGLSPDKDDRSQIGKGARECSEVADKKWGMDMRLNIRLNRILLCAGVMLAMLPLAGCGVAVAQQDAAMLPEDVVAGIPRVTLTVDPDALQGVLDSRDHTYRAKDGSVSVELPEGTSENSVILIPSALAPSCR